MASIVTLLGVCVAGAVILAAPARRRPGVVVALGLAVGSAAVMTVRTSPWVVVPAILILSASLVLAAQDRLWSRSGWLPTLVRFGSDVQRSVPWLASPVRGATTATARSGPLLRGLALAVAVLVPLIWLLASADPVFGRLLATVIGRDLWLHVVITAVLLPVTAGLALGARRTDRSDLAVKARPKAGSMVEGSMVLGGVATVLGVWGLTQVVVALGGADRLLSTIGLTAAQNARQGFFQLVAVVGLLVLVIIGVDHYVERSTGAARRWFLALTTLIGLETLGVVVATYSRLALYIQGFGHTMLRTAVAWFLAWLAVAMFVLVLAVNRPPGSAPPSRPRSVGTALFVLAGLWVIAFGASNPEARVAGDNLDHSRTVALDAAYLTENLGADAVPAIVERLDRQPAAIRNRIEAGLCRRIDEPGPAVTEWNLAQARADAALGTLDCP